MSRAERGFSLLEIMVALAVLGMSLVVLTEITTNNVRATYHARMITTATFLARAKMSEIEDTVLYEGFSTSDQEDAGDFSKMERPEFRFRTLIQKIELPADMAQQAQDANQQKMEEANGNPLSAMAGFMGGFMTTLIEPIRVGIEESVRRIVVTVYWDEPGRPEQSFDVETFMTDPAKLDMAVQAIGQPPGGSQSGAGGTSGGQQPGGAAGSSGSRPPSSGSSSSGSPSGSGRRP